VIRVTVLLLLLVSLAPLQAEVNASVSPSPILDPEKEGRELAAKLRSAAPPGRSQFSGVLQITTRGDHVHVVPIVSLITAGPNSWEVVYRTSPSYQGPAETVSITHTPGQPNAYLVTSGTNGPAAAQLTQPFAGSDFWLMDLGLEFFHWPQQRAIRSEMSRGRPCRVLESVAPKPAGDGYARVLSWIDLETGGVLQAEAYDQHNRVLKKFAMGSFKKIAGHWQLRDMKIRNARTGQQTELKFDLQKK